MHESDLVGVDEEAGFRRVLDPVWSDGFQDVERGKDAADALYGK